jgi:hypothetical protein
LWKFSFGHFFSKKKWPPPVGKASGPCAYAFGSSSITQSRKDAKSLDAMFVAAKFTKANSIALSTISNSFPFAFFAPLAVKTLATEWRNVEVRAPHQLLWALKSLLLFAPSTSSNSFSLRLRVFA